MKLGGPTTLGFASAGNDVGDWATGEKTTPVRMFKGEGNKGGF